MPRLVVWRHGRTAWNATRRFQGQTDVELDETGISQAIAAAPRIAAYQPDVIISSDLKRATQTADELAKITGLGVELDPRLRERHFGPWQGLTAEEIGERFPDQFARWRSVLDLDDPAIERQEALAARVGDAFREIAQRVGDGTAVLVMHGGSARAGCGTLLGWPMELWGTLGALSNCAGADLAYTVRRGWQLNAYNF